MVPTFIDVLAALTNREWLKDRWMLNRFAADPFGYTPLEKKSYKLKRLPHAKCRKLSARRWGKLGIF